MGVGYTFFMTANALPGAIGGRWPRRIPQADAAIERGDTLGLKTGQLESRRCRACIAQLQGDHKAVLEYTHQIEELLEGTDEAIQPVWMKPTCCQSLIATGRLDEAEQRLETTLEAARKADMPHWEAMALKVRGHCMLRGVMRGRR
jgi:ATP/maltotriose-dependent transcriptional regulator MalT